MPVASSRPERDPPEPGAAAPGAPPREPSEAARAGRAPEALAPLARGRAQELVAHADQALASLEASAEARKHLREAARALLRGATPATAAAFAASLALAREHEARSHEHERDLLDGALAVARALLEATGATPDASPTQDERALRRELVPDAAPRGTVLRVVAPAWRGPRGELVAPGVALASAGPRHPLEAALDRALRTAKRLARRAEDVTARASELLAGVEALDREGAIARALEGVRLVESLAALHAGPGQDLAESGLADLVLFLETHGVRRVPAPGAHVELRADRPDGSEPFETEHLRVRVAEAAAPAGTVLERARSAFVRDGTLVGEKGEVVVSRGVESEDERRLEALARAQAPGSVLPRGVLRWKKLPADERRGEPGARALVALLRELGHEVAAWGDHARGVETHAGRAARLTRSHGKAPEPAGALPEAAAIVERLLAALGAERVEPRGEPAPGEAAVAERVPDARPEGSIVRVVEAGWRLGGRVLEPAKVAVSLGPRAALPALLDAAVARAAGDGAAKELILAAQARVRGLAADALEGAGGRDAALDLALALDARGPAADERLRRELDAYLAARGLTSFPGDASRAAAELERSPADFAVERRRSERPRGEVVSVEARGFRDASGTAIRRARVVVSEGPEDPLAKALRELARAIGGLPVPAISPLAGLENLAASLEKGPRAGTGRDAIPGTGADASADPSADPLVRVLEHVRAAQELVAASPRADSEAAARVLEARVYPALAACGVAVFPAPDARALLPSLAARVEAEVRDAAEAPGALLEVRLRGLASGERVFPARVVVSAGPRPALLDAAEIAAAGGGVLAPLASAAAELERKLAVARRAFALGLEGEGKARDAAIDAGVAFLRAAERVRAGLADPIARASLDSFLDGQLRPALALAHDQVEVFPLSREGLDGRELETDAGYEVEGVHDAKAPAGKVLAVLRAGVRDRRARTPILERARVVVSLGKRPPFDEALDRLVALASRDALAPPGIDDRVRALRDASRGLVRERGTALEPKVREALGQALAGLLDALEPRTAAGDSAARELASLLDQELLPAARALGIRSFPDDGEPVAERPSGKIEVAREHSDAPAGSVLRRVRRGIEVDGRALRTARIVVSLGKKDDLAVLAEELEAALGALSPAARAPLEQAVARERARSVAALAGDPPPAPEVRALALLDALDAALAAASEPERASLLERTRGALDATFARLGLALFPRAGEPLPDPVRRAPAALELEGARAFDGKPRGTVISIARLGVLRGDEVVRPARARLDLGPPPAWLAAVEDAARSGASLAPLLERVRDPRVALGDEALVLELHDAHRASPAARAALERALAALGAEVFPRAGEPLPADLAPDAVQSIAVYADGVPPGSVVRVGATGLRRAGQVLRPAQVEVSRGPMSTQLKTLSELAAAPELPEATRAALAPLVARLEALPPEQHAGDPGDEVLVEALGALEGAGDLARAACDRVVALLRERGYVVAPDAPGNSLDALKAVLGTEAALEAPRRRFGTAAPGEVLAVERRAVVRGELVRKKARVVVCAGPPSELHAIVSDVREKLSLETGDAASLKELDEVLERIADAKPERLHLLALPVMNVLHRRNAKDKHGADLKTYLRSKHVKEIVAYAGFPATELGPKQLEEVRVSSDREKGKIVRVLRPGFVEEKTGVVLQKVQAEVSR